MKLRYENSIPISIDEINGAFNLLKNKAPRDWHVYFVYRDKEFIYANEKLLTSHSINVRASRVWNEGLVPASIAGEFISERKKLIEFYCISLEEWKRFNTRPLVYLPLSIASFEYEEKTSTFHVRLKPVITHDDLDILYFYIKESRTDNLVRRRKGQEEPALVYAIFKAKQKNMEFNDIFRLYKNKFLKHYPHLGKRLVTPKDLRDYYYLYSPEKFTDPS